MNPSTNDESGFLCEGFDTPPRIMMPHTPPYYLTLAEQCGLVKAKELYAYDMDVSSGPVERLARLSAIAYKKNPGLTVRKLDLKYFKNEIDRAIAVYNAAWEKNWGFVPWTDKEFHTIAGRLKSLLLLDTTLLAEMNGKPVGMLIAVPDYNMVMKRMNGRLFPLGIIKFLYYKKKIDALRLMIMGVVKEHRQRGIEGVMYYESLKNAMQLGFKKCEFSWILDDNVMTQRAAEMMGGKLYKKYRIYESRG
jgi:GNAT superfamily N-acetyltransferase